MSAVLKKRLAKLEARKRNQRIDTREMSLFELARRATFILTSASIGHGGDPMLAHAQRLCRLMLDAKAGVSGVADVSPVGG